MTKEETLKTVGEKIKGMHTCMFVTMNGTEHRGRPLATQDVDFDGSVWFMTQADSRKVSDIKANNHVALMYGDGSIKFVSMDGTAELSQDKAKIKELWNPFYKAWFENEDDPNIMLIKVSVTSGEYWDHKGGKLGAYADMAVSAVTGKTMEDHDQNQKFTL